jgi:GxxExxY protein
MDENSVAASVVNCALEIHKELGPRLLESVYEVLLAEALRERGFSVERQKPIPICFPGFGLVKTSLKCYSNAHRNVIR